MKTICTTVAILLLACNQSFCQSDVELISVYGFGDDILSTIDVNDPFHVDIGLTAPADRVTSLAINSDGQLYGVSSPFGGPGSLFQFDPQTGAVLSSIVIDEIFPDGLDGLAFGTNGVLYAVGLFDTDLCSLDLETGKETFIGSTGLTCLPNLTCANDGYLYTWQGDNGCTSQNGSGLNRIDPATGIAVDVNPAIGGLGINASCMALGADGNVYMSCFDNDARLYRVNLSDGSITQIGDNSFVGPFGLAGVGAVLLGDVNCDQTIDLLDVAPFVDAIAEGVFIDKADVNLDGEVNLLDVTPFINLLSGS